MKHKLIFSAVLAITLFVATTQSAEARHRCRRHCRQHMLVAGPIMPQPPVRIVLAPRMMRPHCGVQTQQCRPMYHPRMNQGYGHYRGYRRF